MPFFLQEKRFTSIRISQMHKYFCIVSLHLRNVFSPLQKKNEVCKAKNKFGCFSLLGTTNFKSERVVYLMFTLTCTESQWICQRQTFAKFFCKTSKFILCFFVSKHCIRCLSCSRDSSVFLGQVYSFSQQDKLSFTYCLKFFSYGNDDFILKAERANIKQGDNCQWSLPGLSLLFGFILAVCLTNWAGRLLLYVCRLSTIA